MIIVLILFRLIMMMLLLMCESGYDFDAHGAYSWLLDGRPL
jgi:hypothetical protein